VNITDQIEEDFNFEEKLQGLKPKFNRSE